MFAALSRTVKSNEGSAIVIALLVIVSLSILAAGFALVTNTETNISSLQALETRAFYIAQTALDALRRLTPGARDATLTCSRVVRGKGAEDERYLLSLVDIEGGSGEDEPEEEHDDPVEKRHANRVSVETAVVIGPGRPPIAESLRGR